MSMSHGIVSPLPLHNTFHAPIRARARESALEGFKGTLILTVQTRRVLLGWAPHVASPQIACGGGISGLPSTSHMPKTVTLDAHIVHTNSVLSPDLNPNLQRCPIYHPSPGLPIQLLPVFALQISSLLKGFRNFNKLHDGSTPCLPYHPACATLPAPASFTVCGTQTQYPVGPNSLCKRLTGRLHAWSCMPGPACPRLVSCMPQAASLSFSADLCGSACLCLDAGHLNHLPRAPLRQTLGQHTVGCILHTYVCAPQRYKSMSTSPPPRRPHHPCDPWHLPPSL